MEEFDFNAPIDTEIVYEDSDEDTKPINELEVIKELNKTYSPNKANELNVQETNLPNILNECNNKDLPTTPLPRTVINMKNAKEFISRNVSNVVNGSSYTPNHIKDNCDESLYIEKNIQHQKHLDMPSLDDDEVDTDAFIKHICEKKSSQKPKHSKDTNFTQKNDTTQKSKKKTSTNSNKQVNKLNTQNERNTNNVKESELLFSSYTNSIYNENTLPKSKKRKPNNNIEQENRLNIQNEGNHFNVQKESELLSSSNTNSIYKEDTTQKTKKRKPTNNNEQEKRLSIEANNVQQERDLLNTMTVKNNFTDKSVSNANIVAHKNSNNTTNIDVPLTQREIDQTSIYSHYFVRNDKTHQVVQNQSNKNNELTSVHNKTCEVLGKYFKELLSTISEHIIFIMNSYQSYMKVKSQHSDPVMHEHAKMLFNRNKTYFFELTYSSVLNIMIPKENDANFVKHFIDDTIYIANSKGNRYTRAHIEPLFFEMISWVKLNKVYIENVSKKYYSPSAEALKSILNHKNAHISAERSAHSMQYQELRTPNVTLHYKNQDQEGPVTEKTNVPTTGRTENTLNFNPRIHNPPIYSDTIRPQNAQVNYDFTQYNANNLNTSYNQGIQANLQTIHGNKSYQTWRCQPTAQPWQNEAQTAQNFLQSPSNQSIPKQWDCSPPVPDVSPIESTRSISRDSGFISPRTDQLNNKLPEEKLQSAPRITHVTSLNPNVSFITDGVCCVCAKMTKKKCLGCFKCYYCSDLCQQLDWKNHMNKCK